MLRQELPHFGVSWKYKSDIFYVHAQLRLVLCQAAQMRQTTGSLWLPCGFPGGWFVYLDVLTYLLAVESEPHRSLCLC